MPCRALEAFGQTAEVAVADTIIYVLMPCRALEAFGRKSCPLFVLNDMQFSLNALSGIGGVWTRVVQHEVQGLVIES